MLILGYNLKYPGAHADRTTWLAKQWKGHKFCAEQLEVMPVDLPFQGVELLFIITTVCGAVVCVSCLFDYQHPYGSSELFVTPIVQSVVLLWTLRTSGTQRLAKHPYTLKKQTNKQTTTLAVVAHTLNPST